MTLRCPNGCEDVYFEVSGTVEEDNRVATTIRAVFHLDQEGCVQDYEYGDIIDRDTYDTVDSENNFEESEAVCSNCGARAINDDLKPLQPKVEVFTDEEGNEYV